MGRLFESAEKMQEYYDLPYGKSGGRKTASKRGAGSEAVTPLATGFKKRKGPE